MTNSQIIYSASVQYAEEGILKYTGRYFETTEGDKVPEVEEIHTFAEWKKIGRIVRKGEKSKVKITIWNKGKDKTVKDKETGEDVEKPGRFYQKEAYFFTLAQTEELKEA